MAKFDNAKIGDRVWNSVYGWGRIIEVNKDECYGIKARFPYSDIGSVTGEYTFSGEICTEDKYPVLFWNELHIPTDKEDKRPFDLVEFLRENLQPKEFRIGEENFYLYFDAEDEMWYSFSSEIDIVITVYFKTCTRELVDELDDNKVTPQQLKDAYKTLGWL